MIKKMGLIIIFIFMLLPIYFMVTGSFQDMQGVMRMPPQLIPTAVTLNNYQRIFALDSIEAWVFNSVIGTACTALLSVFISSCGGYVFAFYSFKYKSIMWKALLLGLMVPRISFIIPLYVVIKKIGLSGTLAATILPIVFSPVGLYLARTYFETVPKSLLESARLDGASEFMILRFIVAPISKPILAVLAVFASINYLQDYIWQALVLQISERQTLLVALMRFANTRGGGELSVQPVSRLLSVGVILLIPLVLIFIFANKYFIDGVGGAVKE